MEGYNFSEQRVGINGRVSPLTLGGKYREQEMYIRETKLECFELES